MSKKSLWIIPLILLFISWRFLQSWKTPPLGDEVWSFSFANGDGVAYLPYYEGVWVTDDDLYRYQITTPENAFNYPIVLEELKQTDHPPLFFLILHTLTSYFPNTASKVFNLMNLPFWLLAVYWFYKIAQNFLKKKSTILFATLFFGFLSPIANLLVVVRMYMMLVCFATGFTYYIIEYNKTHKLWQALLCGLMIVLGALTHYYMYIYAFFFVLFALIRNFKKSLPLAFVSLIAVGISLYLWPQTYLQFFSNNDNLIKAAEIKHFNFVKTLSAVACHIASYVFMFLFRFNNNTPDYAVIAIFNILILIIILPFCNSPKKFFAVVKKPYVAEMAAVILVTSCLNTPVIAGDSRYLAYCTPLLVCLLFHWLEKLPRNYFEIALILLFSATITGPVLEKQFAMFTDITDSYILTYTEDNENGEAFENVNLSLNLITNSGFRAAMQTRNNLNELLKKIKATPKDAKIFVLVDNASDDFETRLTEAGVLYAKADKTFNLYEIDCTSEGSCCN